MKDIVQRLRSENTMLGYYDAPSIQEDAALEIERLREALHAIVCNTEPSAIKHRDYDHLANAIYVWASAALREEK